MLQQGMWPSGTNHNGDHWFSPNGHHVQQTEHTAPDDDIYSLLPEEHTAHRGHFLINPLLPEPSIRELQNELGLWSLSKYSYLLVVAVFFIELFLPLLIWKTPIPGPTRWIGDGLVMVIAIIAFTRMLVFDYVPSGFLLVLGTAVVGAVVATFEGQSGLATGWGLWRMFMYPMIAFFAYLQPLWPKDIAAKSTRLLILLLGMEVIVQLGQFAAGQTPGDNLAGTMGWKGVGSLVMFVFVVLCISFGKWLVSGNWLQLTFVIAMGLVASVFGEMKVYPAALLAIAAFAALFYLLRGGRLTTILYAGMILAVATVAFLLLYNLIISQGRGVRRLEAYTDLGQVTKYLNNVNYNSDTGRYNLGRGFAFTYGLQLIQRDTTTMLFGMGIGTRNESTSLGVVGEGLQDSLYGLTSGTSLLVLMQETGAVGLLLFFGFTGWLVFTLLYDIAQDPDSDDTVLRYGIVLFSLFWPLWLWYHRAWSFGPSMVLYWAFVGYLLSRRPQPRNTNRLFWGRSAYQDS